MFNLIQKLKKWIDIIDKKNEKVEFEKILYKCISENTHIIGVAGAGKSNFLNIIANTLYQDKKTFLMCSNSTYEMGSQLQKHKLDDDIIIFLLDKEKTHSIDFDYLFSIDKFLNFVCDSEESKKNIKIESKQSWFSFFNEDSNKKYFKEKYWNYIKYLINNGMIDEHGDLNSESSQKPISIYILIDYYSSFFKEEEKDIYMFLLIVIQLILKENINVIFDEEVMFFNGYQNNYIDILNVELINNKHIFCSQLFNSSIDDFQKVCFKNFIFDNSLSEKMKNMFKNLYIKIKMLSVGTFLFFDKYGRLYSEDPIVVPFYGEKNKEIDLSLYCSSKQKKLYNKINKELPGDKLIKKKTNKI